MMAWVTRTASAAHLSLLKGLLQNLVDILVNLVKLVLLDVALLQQGLAVLLVRILVLLDCLPKPPSR